MWSSMLFFPATSQRAVAQVEGWMIGVGSAVMPEALA